MRGIGIDLVRIARFGRVKISDHKKWRRVFSAAEWQYAFRAAEPKERLAAMFAAKEAGMKAAGKAGAGEFLTWEIAHREGGVPFFAKHPLTKRRRIFASVSHEGDLAAAIVAIV